MSKALDNSGGLIQAARDFNLNTRGYDLINSGSGEQGGMLSFGDMQLTTGNIDNTDGLIAANLQLTLKAEDLSNRGGKVIAGDKADFTLGNLDNRSGQLTALGDFSLKTLMLENDEGGSVQSGENLLINTQGKKLSNSNSGENGGITSQGIMTLLTGEMDNQHGVIISNQQLALDAGDIDNQHGTLYANQQLTLNAGDISNQHGLLTANQQLTLNAGFFDNREGILASGSSLDAEIHKIDNSHGGQIVAKEALTLSADEINNYLGQIQALGSVTLDAAYSLLNNSGLIQSGERLLISATTLDNSDTRETGDGILGRDVEVNVTQLNNSAGEILADSALKLDVNDRLNNASGLLSAQQTADIKAASVTNSSGDIETGENLALQAGYLSGDGQLLSLGDMILTLQQDLHNTGTLQASHDLHLTTKGTLTNDALIQSGNLLEVTADKMLNNARGEFSSGTTQLTASNTLINFGLIDGFYTRLEAATVSNIGSGRIYGDALAIQAGTLNNLAAGGKAATLAARQRMDLGVGVLNNLNHALIYSDGSLFLGGRLNADYQATGQASVLNNHSATIESSGNMALNVASLNNINDNFSLENVLVSEEKISEYLVPYVDGEKRFNDKDYTIYIYQDEVNILCIEDVLCHSTNGDKFTHYDYTRTITEDRIKNTDPGQIIAGGHLSINAEKVLNDKSQIIAGGSLAIQANSVENVEVEAYRQINDEGIATSYWRKQNKGGDSSKTEEKEYVPPTVIQGIDLKASTLEEFTRGEGSGATINDHQAADINGIIQGGGDLQLADLTEPASGWNGAIVLPQGKTFEVNAGEAGNVVRIVGPNTRLPENSLFQLRPDSSANYLIETDPRFTQAKQWLGSDYMMQAFTSNHDNTLKRLGDGYYEQKLIREQVTAMTGQRFLSGYSNDEEQFRALMDNGIEFAQKYNLIPGVALSSAQIALLTGDMVWMVAQTVRMPDGSSRQVLVPQVYAVVKEGDLDGSGALLAGRNVSLNLSGDLTNSGRISSLQGTQIKADNINNLNGTIRGNDVALEARTDINNIGGKIVGNDSLFATAGRDINATTTTRAAVSADGNFARTTLDRVAGFYVEGTDGKLALQAGRDITLTAAQVMNSGESGQTLIAAGRDLNLTTVTTGSRDDITWSKDNWQHHANSQQVGSEIAVQGDVALSAQHDVNITAGNVTAGGVLAVGAGNDLHLSNGINTSEYDIYSKTTGSSSIASKTTTITRDTMHRESVNGSNLSGDTVTLHAGHNIDVTGSNVVSSSDMSIAAGNNLTIQSATESRDETHLRSEKKSGISGTGGIGVTMGSSTVKTTDEGKSLSNVGSLIGSTEGNVSLAAGNNLTVSGSDVLAAKDLSLTGKEVNILSVENQSKQTHTVEQKQSGLTLALSGTAASMVNTALSGVQNVSNASTGRLAALEGMKAALSGVQLAQGQSLAEAGGSQGSVIGVNLSYGSQSSTSTQTATQNQSQGSNLTAGNNLTINATGTDINIQGSQLQAGKNASLTAARDVNLSSSQNSQTLDGKNESHGGSVGVGINFGQGANGISLSASANKGKGSETGNGVTHNETTLNAGNNLIINSGRDTTLTGAQISGEKVTMDVGRNLTLASEKDTDYYDSKQQNASAGGSISLGGGSGSISLSQDKMHSSFESVQEQSGIFAGEGGFDITVGKHTQLNGAVIGSTATADKNKLDTGTLGFSDIENSAEFKVEHMSASANTSSSLASQIAGNLASNLLIGADSSGSDSSTTRAAVSDGSVIIRDQESQKQNVGDLSRDVEHANQMLSPIFDKEKEQNRIREAQLIGEIGSQVGDIAHTQGKIIATEAANEKMKGVTPEQLQMAKEQWSKTNPGKEPTSDDIASQAYINFYNQAFAESGMGTGGKVQQAIQAATAVVQGLAGGDITNAIAGGAAPYLAEAIKKTVGEENKAANLMAHAAVNAALSLAKGDNVVAGATGAAVGEAMGMISHSYYGKPASELTETERQTVSALATLAAGLAGGLIGDSSADSVSAAQAGKTTVENNLLGGNEESQAAWIRQHGIDMASCADAPGSASCQKAINERDAVGLALATGGVALLPGGAQTMWGLGAGANAGINYLADGTIDPANAAIAGWVNVISMGNGLTGTVGWNAAGGAFGSWIDDKNPLTGAIITGVGAGFGYGIGKGISVGTNASANWSKGGWDPKFNPTLQKYTEIKGDFGLSKEVRPSNLPGTFGDIGASSTSEYSGKKLETIIKDKLK